MNKTLSDFMSMEVQRTGATAQLIVDYALRNGEHKPIRLLGFMDDATKSDYEIREAGFHYYQALIEQVEVEKRRPADDLGTGIAETILKVLSVAIVISGALIAAAWLLTQ